MSNADVRKVAVILVEFGVQDQEFWYPYYRLKEAGFKVTVIGPNNQDKGIAGKYGIPITADLHFGALRSGGPDADVIVIPGGWECPEKLRMNQDVLDYVMVQYQRGAVIGAICHGPLVLISAGLVKGKRMTCYKGMKDGLVNAGAEYLDYAPAIAHDRLVTARHYNDNPAFMELVLFEAGAFINLSGAKIDQQ